MDPIQKDIETANTTHIEKEDTSEYKDSDGKSMVSKDYIEDAEKTIAPALRNAHAVKGDDSDGKVPMTPKRYAAMLILGMSYVGAQLPLFFIGGCLTFIVEAVHNPAARGWATTAYGVALAAVTPFSGYLQDTIGRRYIAILGAVLVCVGIALIGSAHNFTQLIFGTVFSGIGAGAIELAATAGLAELVSVKNRGYILAMMFAFIIPFAPYVLYSQLISEHSTWRWTMWLSLIWNGLVVAGLSCFYFPKSHVLAEDKQVWKELDLMGGFLSISGVVIFLVGLQFGGTTYPWRSAAVIAPMVIGILLCILFVLWEWKGSKHPMVPAGMFEGQRVTGVSVAVAFLIGMDLYAILNFLPLAFATIYNPDPLQIGLKALGFGFGQTLGGVIANFFMTVFKDHHKENLLINSIIMATFMTSMAAMNPTNPSLAVGLSTIAGFGVGGVLIPIGTVAMTACPDAYLATMVALVNAVRYLGGSIGYSIYYSIFSQKLANRLPNYIAKAAIKAGLPLESTMEFVGTFVTAPATISSIQGVTPQVVEAATLASRWAYSDSMKYVWYSSLPFGVLCIIGFLVMEKNGKFVTNRVAATLH